MASSSSEINLPMNSIMHMITNKLCSTNYLIRKSQLEPVLSLQGLFDYVDGSSSYPTTEVLVDQKPAANPEYASWVAGDKRAIIILQASLFEEAATEIIGLSTAREIWSTLEHAYSNSSIKRIQTLRDQLRGLSKGNLSVSDFGRRFKAISDQLSAIGHPVDEPDKLHWFLRGLGLAYESFSTAIRASKPTPTFRDLLAQAENHELFIQSLYGSTSPIVAFNARVDRTQFNNHGCGARSPRGGRGHGRRPPHCQLCRKDGHFANNCPQLASFTQQAPGNDSELAKAFLAQCHVTTSGPDWSVADTGATDHMLNSTDNIIKPEPYLGPNNEGDPSTRKL
ncbi:putative RNA-directed DNA polymerase [Helianthus debilis subsp. tardiflorus]